MKKMNTGVKRFIFYTTITSPLGTIYIAFTKKGVSRIGLGMNTEKGFVKDLEDDCHIKAKRHKMGLTDFKKELRSYFSSSHKVKSFSFRSPLDFLEGTPFEKEVWLEIKKVPYGKVISYKDLAVKVGRPGAARAIGSACRKNPIPILIPCHRIIGNDNSLKGYSSGIKIKRQLLEIEGVLKDNGSQEVI